LPEGKIEKRSGNHRCRQTNGLKCSHLARFSAFWVVEKDNLSRRISRRLFKAARRQPFHEALEENKNKHETFPSQCGQTEGNW
jgi:hypothetical protein